MSDDWGTPDWIMSLFRHFHDPCPIAGKGGLTSSWGGQFENKVFVNPPYSNPRPWVEKAIKTHRETSTTIVMLLRHDSSTQWFRMLKEAGARFLMIEGRLTFKGPNSKPCAFPSVLAVLS